ncbi:MAG: sugar phosphate isomerase/epimerase [Bryobacteraceae bacterium]|nr:sugar phosphate isomerase/epimerase [Bryobacteraceae bacterium]
MQTLSEREIGVIFWATADPRATLAEYTKLGLRCGQLGIPGDYPLEGAAEAWKSALEACNFRIFTLVGAYAGEDYADIPTVERTVGFIPESTRKERVERTLKISDLAAQLGVPGIGCHVGFVPHDSTAPAYVAVRDEVRRICDHAARYGQTFALETGQEPADVLLRFIKDVDRPNLRINFDPANMILYGTGDPIEALGLLAPHVVTVHCKDGDWPPKGVPGALGTEKPLGQGSVGMERFINKLKEIGYTNPLIIEREIPDQAQRMQDIASAIKLLESLRH